MKLFTTYEEQIKLLKSRNLIINDEDQLMAYLQNIGYYNLINGYSFIFKRGELYRNRASVNDILALYTFDKNLRNIIYKYALNFESKLKSLISYTFSKYHGEDHKKYLVRENFDKDERKNKNIFRLIDNCNELVEKCADKNNIKYRNYIGHYVEDHKHVPLWVLVRAMTMGDASMFYANMKLNEKKEIADIFQLTPSQLEIMLKMLVSFRNTVAHDERVFCKKIPKDRLPSNLEIYEIMRIEKKNGVPRSGVQDFLSLMIIFKYLLSAMEFAGFWIEFEAERELLIKNIKSHFVADINNLMGLKSRWKNLKNYKIPKLYN